MWLMSNTGGGSLCLDWITSAFGAKAFAAGADDMFERIEQELRDQQAGGAIEGRRVIDSTGTIKARGALAPIVKIEASLAKLDGFFGG